MRILVCVLVCLTLVGCGRIDRWWAGTTGNAVESCERGVVYYQFTSGAAPAYSIDGKLIPCK
jgi:hypothetical protein